MNDAAAEIAERARCRLRPRATTVVAVAGPVAVGKSWLAVAVADALRSRGMRVEVVSTDGFLYPNTELHARGGVARKGFPETYDVDALWAFLSEVRDTPDRLHDVAVPIYSHETYDVVVGEHRLIPPTDVLVLEGVNALSATTDLVDLGVYVDAPLAEIETWYVERFAHLVENATPGSFYGQFAGMEPAALADLARSVYRAVNLPNLTEHIGPSRALADVVVEKRAHHELGEIVDARQR